MTVLPQSSLLAPQGNLWRRAIHEFGSLKVRPKLVVLHNLFFLVLAIAVYMAVIPVFSENIKEARQRELQMVSQIFAADLPLEPGELQIYHYREGLPRDLGLLPVGQKYLDANATATWQQGSDSLFRNGKNPGEFRRVSLSPEFYKKSLGQARWGLFFVLGSIYALSILVLEFMIMSQYVYRPLGLMLHADAATQKGDREHELIDDSLILRDEIGQIMRSRNQTVLELRRREEELELALSKLEEQDRLVSLGLLSTSVAHELNTPLAVLQGSVEKLLETTRDLPSRERLARMLRVTQRLRKISESLVDFARVRKQVMEPVELRPLIEESWGLVGIDEKASDVNFTNGVLEGCAVIGNADRLVQVFVNLLRNALDAVPRGGVVRVEARRCLRAGQPSVACMVMDSGPGIATDVLPNLFEAFVSTRLDARGTGLGLTVCEGIISQHGGAISASNRAEGGACLEVVLPAAA